MLLELMTGLLLAAAPDSAATQTASAEKAEDRQICRREVETGSLIKGKKICMTAKQWQKISDDNRQELESRSSSGSQSGQ